jgi:hypothetical protein
MSIEAMKQAYEVPLIEQLESVPKDARLVIDDADGMGTRFIPVGRMCHDAAKSLRQAIEQAEKQEPFGWAKLDEVTEHFNSVNCGTIYRLPGEGSSPLYTTPQPQQQEIDWKDQYEKQKRRSDMWQAKYEKDIGPIEKAGPVTAQREWQGLTDEEIALVCAECAASAHNWNDISFAHAIEAKLKDKNHVS